jgi:serine/threonine-protein kinase HipA
MASAATVLGVHLLAPSGQTVRAGTLTRDGARSTAFIVDEAYLRDEARPLLSLSWHTPGDSEQTRARLADRRDKIGLHGYLPPWFQGLLPEGALRDLVVAEMGPGDHDSFDVILRLGGDLPGAVLVIPDNDEAPASAGPLQWERVAGLKAPVPKGAVKFSLAGVQLKFTATAEGERLTAPVHSGEGRLILKLASDRYPDLPEAEYSAMILAAGIGVRTASCRLTPVEAIEGVPEEFLTHGPTALVVERFDRTPGGGRLHMEDAGQILEAWGDRKYTRGNTETVLNMIRRFSTDWREDVLEGFRRLTADVLLGNGDNHLKNWSFLFPAPGEIRLSPAYDIVPTVFFHPKDELALRFAGARTFDGVDLRRIRRVADFLKLDPAHVVREVSNAVRTAVETWPALMKALPLTRERRAVLTSRLETLPLVREIREAASG